MLVLKRSVGEEVVIFGPDGVELGVVKLAATCSAHTARLGFTFPKEYQVHRREIADKIGSRILAGLEDIKR